MKTTLLAILLLITLCVTAQENISDVQLYSTEVFGQTLKYIEKGQGETLILLHGLGSNLERWNKNIDELSKEYNVIALDQIGFGRSDKPLMPYKGSTLVEFLNGFMTQKGIKKATLIGNSMGGWVSALFAIAYPEKLDKLILVDPAFLLGLPDNADIGEIYGFANPTTKNDMASYVKRIYHQTGNLLSEEMLTESLIKKLSWNDGYTVYHILISLKNSKDLLNDKLDLIKAETLIVHGKNDAVVPIETIEVLRREITNNKTIIYENSGHSPMWEESERFNKDVFSFLGK